VDGSSIASKWLENPIVQPGRRTVMRQSGLARNIYPEVSGSKLQGVSMIKKHLAKKSDSIGLWFTAWRHSKGGGKVDQLALTMYVVGLLSWCFLQNKNPRQ
jgi:hypothetical protein